MIQIEEEYNFTFTHQPHRYFELLKPDGPYRSLLEKWGVLPDSQFLCFSFDQPYHRGMRFGFLKSLFQSDAVRGTLTLANGRGDVNVGVPYVSRIAPDSIQFTELSCKETSLDMFDRVVNNEIVRETLRHDDDDDKENEANDETPQEMQRVCQMVDAYLPCGITVSDQLRGVFMLGEESEYNYMFTEEEKREFLYHVMWRLLTGGSLNQWEDNFVVYKDAVRALYKDLVCVGRDDETDELKLLTHVMQVERVGGIPLFPRSDECYPSNGNYLYVVVNPSRKEVLLWYHGFWSSF